MTRLPSVAFVRPETDPTEVALSAWGSLVLGGIAGTRGLSVTDLSASAASPSAVAAAVKTTDVVLYFGHGLPDALGTANRLIDATSLSVASVAILIAIACDSARKLGPAAIRGGQRAFIGFDDTLVVYLPQPSLFGRVIQSAFVPFLRSRSQIAHARTIITDGFQQIEWLYRGPLAGTPDAGVIWLAAHINWRGITLCGDPTAVLR